MAKRFSDTEKYKKQFIRSLPAKYKLFWDYICLDCNHAGIWQVDLEVAQIRLGKDAIIDLKEALQLFNTGERRIQIVNGGSKWFIAPFIDFQYGGLNPSNRVHLSVINELRNNKIKPLASPLIGAKDKDKDKDKNKDIDKYKDIEIEENKMRMDLEQHLLNCWGRDGRQSSYIITGFVDLIKKHGREKVLEAIETAARYNKKSYAYVLGILEPKDPKTEQDKEFEKFKKIREAKEGKK